MCESYLTGSINVKKMVTAGLMSLSMIIAGVSMIVLGIFSVTVPPLVSPVNTVIVGALAIVAGLAIWKYLVKP